MFVLRPLGLFAPCSADAPSGSMRFDRSRPLQTTRKKYRCGLARSLQIADDTDFSRHPYLFFDGLHSRFPQALRLGTQLTVPSSCLQIRENLCALRSLSLSSSDGYHGPRGGVLAACRQAHQWHAGDGRSEAWCKSLPLDALNSVVLRE